MTTASSRRKWSIPTSPITIPLLTDELTDQNDTKNIGLNEQRYPSIWRLKTHKFINRNYHKNNHTKKILKNNYDIITNIDTNIP